MVEEAPIPWRTVLPDAVAYAAFSISAFGLSATLMENYVFSEPANNPWYNLQGAVAFNGAVDAMWNLYLAVFGPLFPRQLFLVIPAFDAYALTYFLLLMLALGVLTRRHGLRGASMLCSLVGSSILFLYEVGLTLVSPYYLDMHVTNVQMQIGLGWFSNLDLLAVSAVVTVILLMAKFGLRKLLGFLYHSQKDFS
jgi:hypothetical protein